MKERLGPQVKKVNFKAMRHESTSFGRAVADKSPRVTPTIPLLDVLVWKTREKKTFSGHVKVGVSNCYWVLESDFKLWLQWISINLKPI